MSCDSNFSELIIQLQNTDEYIRSKAIAGAIQLLISKISSLESSNKLSIKSQQEWEQLLKQQAATISQHQSESQKLHSDNKLLKSKLGTAEKYIKTLESSIKDFTTQFSAQEKEYDNKSTQFSQILQEYKNIFEECKTEKMTLDSQIAKLSKENKDLHSQLHSLKKDKENDKAILKKLKDYELLLYKMDLENQTFKQELKSYQKREGNDFNNGYQINKIDLNSELNTIDNDYVKNSITTAVNLCTETENDINEINNTNYNNSDYFNSPLNDNKTELDSLVNEIKKTEAKLKDYSNTLIKKEKENDQKHHGRSTTSSEEFQDIMNVMEKQTEKLLQLKKKYNMLVKK